MKSLAVCVVRNAGDFIALPVLHHLFTGVDHCIVVDNGSNDATADILKAISRKTPRLTVINDPSPFDQAKLRNDAIREFVAREKTIVIPFDCDELWALSIRELARTFAKLDASVLRCEVHNFVQARSIVEPSRWSWIRACRKASIIAGDPATLVQERKCSFVESAGRNLDSDHLGS
jgi:glycosyltransferase involved in cell wall biosynthesis